MSFAEYRSKPIIRIAHEVSQEDVIVKVDEKTSTLNNDLKFNHADHVIVGDFIVYLNENDVYHCPREVFLERNHLNITMK